MLYVHVHAARNVRGHVPPLANLFCCATLGERTILRTQTLPGSCDPIWEKGIELIVPSYHGIRLEFEVFCQSRGMGSNDLLGSSHLLLTAVSIIVCNFLELCTFLFLISLFVAKCLQHETQLVQHKLVLVNDIKSHTPMTTPNFPSLFISVIFRNVESVNWTRESLKATFITRTRRWSLASCLDLTTNFMNPAGQGFAFSPHVEENREAQVYPASGRGTSLEEFSSSEERTYSQDTMSTCSC